MLDRARRVFGDDLREGVRDGVSVRVSRLTESFDLLEFVAAKLVDFFVECQVSAFLSGKLTIIKQWSVPVVSAQKMQIPRRALIRQGGLALARDDLREVERYRDMK